MKPFNVVNSPAQDLQFFLILFKRVAILMFFLASASVVRAAVYPFSCTYSRDQAVLSSNSLPDGGSGKIEGSYDDVTNVIIYTINFSIFNGFSISMNFHAPAAFGSSVPSIIEGTAFPTGITSGTYSNSHLITNEQELQLLANLWYSTIQTTGEDVRAQIILGKPGEPCLNNSAPVFTNCPGSINIDLWETAKIQVSGFDANAGQTMGLEVVDLPFGPFHETGLSNSFVREFSWTPTGSPSGRDLIATGTFRLYDNCGGERFCTVEVNVNRPSFFDCVSEPVTVDQNTTINFNTAKPSYTGDPELQRYFTWEKAGPTPDKWKAIFNLDGNPLLIKKGVTITTSLVNGYAPGIVINGDCIKVEGDGHIVVSSTNRNAGSIIINGEEINIEGEIRNEVKGTIGVPGAIAITGKHLINVANSGLVQILGVNGGNTISIFNCDQNALRTRTNNDLKTLSRIGRGINFLPSPGIYISGLLKSYAKGYTGTQNRPNIKVVSFKGDIFVNADSPEPLYDEFLVSGTRFDVWGGLLSWVGDNSIPGKIEVQTSSDIYVYGHGDDPTGTVRKSFGAIAAISSGSDGAAGVVDVRAQGEITGSNRAFDVSGRNRLKTNYAQIHLWGKNINLSRNSPGNSFNPVVDASAASVGDRGGTNDLRACGIFPLGQIIIGAGALVSAKAPPGAGSVQGTNKFIYGSIVSDGTILPFFVNGLECNGGPLFTSCSSVDAARTSKNQEIVLPVSKTKKEKELLVYPNPSRQQPTISYELTTSAQVSLSIFNTLGKKIAVLVNEEQAAGKYSWQWDAKAQPAGVYFVSLKINDKVQVERLILIK